MGYPSGYTSMQQVPVGQPSVLGFGILMTTVVSNVEKTDNGDGTSSWFFDVTHTWPPGAAWPHTAGAAKLIKFWMGFPSYMFSHADTGAPSWTSIGWSEAFFPSPRTLSYGIFFIPNDEPAWFELMLWDSDFPDEMVEPAYAIHFVTVADLIPPPMRMKQRDDGLGNTQGHARLNVNSDSPNQPTSSQVRRSPRIVERQAYQ
jgi:hypothetical protein